MEQHGAVRAEEGEGMRVVRAEGALDRGYNAGAGGLWTNTPNCGES